MKQHAKLVRHEQRKPWKESHQTLTAGVGVVLIITAIIFGIGWRDGYWSKQPQSSKPQPSRHEAQR